MPPQLIAAGGVKQSGRPSVRLSVRVCLSVCACVRPNVYLITFITPEPIKGSQQNFTQPQPGPELELMRSEGHWVKGQGQPVMTRKFL